MKELERGEIMNCICERIKPEAYIQIFDYFRFVNRYCKKCRELNEKKFPEIQKFYLTYYKSFGVVKRRYFWIDNTKLIEKEGK